MQTILVVEDHDMSRDALSRRLERRGYRVVPAIDGVEAVALARSTSPDLILMDLGLPRLDGWAATRSKTEAATRGIPIIVLSAHPQDRHSAMAAGGDDLDSKPIHFDALLLKIEALLERQI